MNAIAFSLFGTSNLYVNGMIRNAELAKTVYPGWKVVVYADTDVPKVALHKLSKLGVDLRTAHRFHPQPDVLAILHS
jgi:hypothetical protein